MVIQHLKQIGKVKRLTKWMLHELIKSQNYHCLECCLLSFYTTITNRFSIGLWRMMKSRLYMTTGKDQLSGWIEKKLQSTSQSQTYTKKMIMVMVWWSAAGLIYYSFLNLGKIITFEKYTQQQINEMHQKLQRLQLALVNRKGPILLHNNAGPPHVAQPML